MTTYKDLRAKFRQVYALLSKRKRKFRVIHVLDKTLDWNQINHEVLHQTELGHRALEKLKARGYL